MKTYVPMIDFYMGYTAFYCLDYTEEWNTVSPHPTRGHTWHRQQLLLLQLLQTTAAKYRESMKIKKNISVKLQLFKSFIRISK